MKVLEPAIVITGLLGLANLMLMFGIIRRLREHSEIIGQLNALLGPETQVLDLNAGEKPAAFAATTLDGEVLIGAGNITIAGFFSTSCSSCPKQVAPFKRMIEEAGLPRSQVLAVIAGPAADLPDYAEELTAVAMVAVEELGQGPVQQSFGVTGYPAFCLLDESGAVQASGFDPRMLPVLAPAS